jgi:hypothetical protein
VGFFIVCFLWYWRLNSGPRACQGEFYPLSHTPSPFCFRYFWDRVSHLCPGHPGPRSSIYTSHVARMTDTCYHTLSVRWGGGLTNFLPKLASNLDPPDLYLPSNWDYRHGSLSWLWICSLKKKKPYQLDLYTSKVITGETIWCQKQRQ